MRWVDRGPEPIGVAGYALQFTQGWIRYFRNREGGRPTDHYWGEFRPILESRTDNICWYCERRCDAGAEYGGRTPTVDHFRPRNRFPELTYEWPNWGSELPPVQPQQGQQVARIRVCGPLRYRRF